MMKKTKQTKKKPAPTLPDSPPAPSAEVTDVSALDEAIRGQIRRFLVEGGTVEDVADMLLSQYGMLVSPVAIQTFYNSDRSIARDRAVHQVDTVRTLKQALRDEKSPLASLAEATLLTGVMGLSRHGELSGNDAQRRFHDQRMYRLIEANQIMKNRLYGAQIDVNRARRVHEIIKYHESKLRCKKMKAQLRDLCQSRDLTPQTLHRIREIYGIVSEPFNPAKTEEILHRGETIMLSPPNYVPDDNLENEFDSLDKLLGPGYTADFDVLAELGIEADAADLGVDPPVCHFERSEKSCLGTSLNPAGADHEQEQA